MFNVEISNPINGAAYQVLFEKFLPAYCNTRERQAEITASFADITEWATTQPPEIHSAYVWAMKKISEDIEHRLKVNDLGNQVVAAYQSIPKPEIDQ